MLSEWNPKTATPIQGVSVESMLQCVIHIVTNGYYMEEFGNIPAYDGSGKFTFKLYTGEDFTVSGNDAKSIAYEAICNILLAVYNPLLQDWFVIRQETVNRLLERLAEQGK